MIEPIALVERSLDECDVCIELFEIDDGSSEAELTEELEKHIKEAEHALAKVEFQVMLGGPNDPRNAFLTIQAGAGPSVPRISPNPPSV